MNFRRTISTCLLAIILATSTACEFSREVDGRAVECIGLQEDKDPRYMYRTSKRNIFWGIIGVSFVLIPTAIWLLAAFDCPTERKPAPGGNTND